MGFARERKRVGRHALTLAPARERQLTDQPTTLERAFEIARSGKYSSLADLAKALKGERYDSVDAQLSGAGLRLQLRTIMAEARFNVRKSGL